MTIERLKAAIQTVVDYNWDDELDDFLENCVDEEGTIDPDPSHIFVRLVELHNFVADIPVTLESIVGRYRPLKSTD